MIQRPSLYRLLLLLLWALGSAVAQGNDVLLWQDGARIRPMTPVENQRAILGGHRGEDRLKAARQRAERWPTELEVLAEDEFHFRVGAAPGVSVSQFDARVSELLEPGTTAQPVYRTGDTEHPLYFIATGELIVGFREKTASLAQARALEANGLTLIGTLPGESTYRFRCPTSEACLPLAGQLAEYPEIAFAYPNWLRPRQSRGLELNLGNDPLLPQQWHLDDVWTAGDQSGTGIQAVACWQSESGSPRQVIGIVDSGVQLNHPDLVENARPDLSWDYLDDDATVDGPPHGTAVAGLAAARGGNGIGGSGVAPLAALAAIRMGSGTTDVNEALALLHQNQAIAVYNNAWGPLDSGNLEGPGPVTLNILRQGVESGRGGLGAVYVWAAGNGLAMNDNANYDGYANSPYVISVGATNRYGRQAYYSEPGANLLVNAPGGDDFAWLTTTDNTGWGGYDHGDYTSTFGGTSAAAALVSGVAALVLDARPTLGWRELKWLLATTAERNDPDDPDWTRNGAGHWFNHKYGFGRVNANAAVAAAAKQPIFPAQRVVDYTLEPNQTIPDGDLSGLQLSLAISEEIVVEEVQAIVDSDHPEWGQLAITLTSPGGTSSRLAEPHASGGAQLLGGWAFSSAQMMGERSRGTWRLRVTDTTPGASGRVRSWRLRIFGHRNAEESTHPIPTLTPNGGVTLFALVAALAGWRVSRRGTAIRGSEVA